MQTQTAQKLVRVLRFGYGSIGGTGGYLHMQSRSRSCIGSTANEATLVPGWDITANTLSNSLSDREISCMLLCPSDEVITKENRDNIEHIEETNEDLNIIDLQSSSTRMGSAETVGTDAILQKDILPKEVYKHFKNKASDMYL